MVVRRSLFAVEIKGTIPIVRHQPLLLLSLMTSSSVLVPSASLDTTTTTTTTISVGTTQGGERDGDGAIGFSPADDDGAGGCVSWAAVLTLEAVHRILTNPTVVLGLFR